LGLKRAVLIGDIHAEDERLAAVLEFVASTPAETVLCTGDIVDGPGNPNRCASLLRDAGVVCVRGNHDRWLLANTMRDLPDATEPASMSGELRDYLLGLPSIVAVDTSAGRAMLCHGLGTNDMRRLLPSDYGYALTSNEDLQDLLARREYEIVIAGHTHRAMVRRFDHLIVINPGTLLRYHDPTFAIADFEIGSVQFYDIDDCFGITAGASYSIVS
jgi:putative phosphoesterase